MTCTCTQQTFSPCPQHDAADPSGLRAALRHLLDHASNADPANDEEVMIRIDGYAYWRARAALAATPPASGPLTPERLMEASAFFGAVITYQQARSILARLTAATERRE